MPDNPETMTLEQYRKEMGITKQPKTEMTLEQYREYVYGSPARHVPIKNKNVDSTTPADAHHRRLADIAGLSGIVRSRALECSSQIYKRDARALSERHRRRVRAEDLFQNDYNAIARKLGWKQYHTHNSQHSEKGFPDNFTLRGHVLIFSELKVGSNKPTNKQEEWLELMRAWRGFLGISESNAVVRVWYPEDWAEIVRVLE
jgi:hypothetical protein